MSKDLEKLAAEMRKMKPSKTARKGGMDAAMAAFTAEFAAKAVTVDAAEKTAIEQNNSQTSQGLSGAARPTGQTIGTKSMDTFRSDMMSKLKSVFSFDMKTKMMMGSCAAALMFAAVIVPGARPGLFETPPQPTEAIEPLEIERPVIEIPKAETPAPSPNAAAEQAIQEYRAAAEPKDNISVDTFQSPETTPAPNAEADSTSNISSVDELLDKVRKDSARTAALNKQREAQFVDDRSQAATTPAQSPKIANIENAVPEFEPPRQGRTQSKIAPQVQIGGAYTGAQTMGQAQSMTPPPPPQIERMSRGQGGNIAVQASAPKTKALPGGLTLEEVPAEYKTVTETVVTQEASTELVTIPAEYETVTETVVVTPQSVEYIVEPAEYEWVKGEIEGSTVEYETTPAQYETFTETVVVQEASTELVTIPPTYETVTETIIVKPEYQTADGSIVPPVTQQLSRRVVKTPAMTQERVIPSITKQETRRRVKTPAAAVERTVPYEQKNGKTRVPVKPARVTEKPIAAVTKQVSRRVVKTPARISERVRPSVPRTYERQVVVTPQKYYLRDDDGNVVREFENRDAFETYKANLPTLVSETPVSTFSVDVDTASYSFFRSSVNRGQLPPASSVRVEEMINYFSYDYDAPRSADEPFKANVTVTPSPWNSGTKLMRIGIKGYVPPVSERPDSNIVFLIDTSGSMNQPNKLPLLINSFKLLLNTLGEDDTVSIVTYAGSAGTVLEPTSAANKNKIIAALNNLRAGGSTAGAAGLELAYNKAMESINRDGINRVILATDGDFNVGFSSPDEMKTFIEEKRKTGIFLSVLGFGSGNYKDDLMQSLAQNGNGVAAYIDTLAEANKVLANEAGSALITIAKDVKIQVEFNPDTIAEYRLIGYETRALKRQDFNNDAVDAGEIGAGHSVTALYELTPVGSPARVIDDLRYVSDEAKPKGNGSDELAFVKIRHKLPNSNTSTLQTFPVGPSLERDMNRASEDMRFAAAVAAVGQKLRGDTQLESFSYSDAIELAVSGKGKDKHGYRAEFIQLLRLVDTMEK